MKKLLLALLIMFRVSTPAYAAGYTSPDAYREIVDNTDPDTLDYLLTITYYEARGESFSGQRAVIEVILNRVLSPEYPNSVMGVISEKGQFSTWSAAKKGIVFNESQADALLAVYEDTPILPSTDYVYFSTKKQRYGHDYIKICRQWFGR